MKTMVLYTSQTGFTKRYAQWIAQALDCECLPLKKIGGALSGDDRVIYGGWVMGNGIRGLNQLRAICAPRAVFAVGASPASEETLAAIRAQNQLGDTPLFYMAGGFRFEQLNLLQRLLLKALKKAVAKKKDKSPQDLFMASALGTSFDASSRDAIAPLIRLLQNEPPRGDARP